MATDAKVLIQIQADTQDINTKLANLGNVLSTISTHTKNIETVGKSTWAIYATGLNQVMDLAQKAIGAIEKIGRVALDVANAFGQQEQAEVKLSAVLAAHGVQSEAVTTALAHQAQALMVLTGESDETIMSAQAMALAMGVVPSKVDAVTRAAMDISRVFGKDLESSTRMVTMAMEGNVRALVRLIPALKGMELGAMSAEQVLQKVRDAVGGVSEKEGDTYLAQIRKLTTGWSELKETVGKDVVPVLRELIKMAQDGITAMQGFLGESNVAVKKQQLEMLNRQIADAEKAVGGDRVMDFKIRATTMTDPKTMLEKWKAQRSALQDELRQVEAVDKGVLEKADKDFKKEPSHALDALIKKWTEAAPKLKLDVEFAGSPGGGGYFREQAEADAEAVKLKQEYKLILDRILPGETQSVRATIDQVAAAKKLNAEKKAYLEFAKIALDVEDQLQQRSQYLFDAAKKRTESQVEASRNELELGRRTLDITKSQYAQGQIDNYEKLIAAEQERYDLLNRSLMTEKQLLEAEEEKDRKIKSFRNQIKFLQADLKELNGTAKEGWDRGIKEWLDEARSAYQAARDLAKGCAQAMQDSFKDVFFDWFDGKLKSLGDYITAFARKVLGVLADIAAQMAAKMVIKGAMGGFGEMMTGLGFAPSFEYHKGGRGLGEASGFRLVPSEAFASARRYHTGLGADEVPIIAQRREMPYIFTPEQMKGMKGGSTSVSVPVSIQYGDDQLARRMRKNIEAMALKTLKENF